VRSRRAFHTFHDCDRLSSAVTHPGHCPLCGHFAVSHLASSRRIGLSTKYTQLRHVATSPVTSQRRSVTPICTMTSSSFLTVVVEA
jgi:hypothetical protein